MRQKILIAAAVLHNPRIVILDEPFSGLDVTAARVLKAFVRSLAAEGKMVVFSSHVLEVVEQVCSRVVILKDGHIVGHDSVDNLRNTLKLPSLDAVFATLVEEDNVERRTSGADCGDAPAMTPRETPFNILWRVFLEQFTANESATSDLQMRRAIIGVFTFLVTPGLFLMMKTMSGYELMLLVAKARNMPQLDRNAPRADWRCLFVVVFDGHDRSADGVHLGHARVRQARRDGARSAAATTAQRSSARSSRHSRRFSSERRSRSTRRRACRSPS